MKIINPIGRDRYMDKLFKIFVKATAIFVLLAAGSSGQTADKPVSPDNTDIRVLEEKVKQNEEKTKIQIEGIEKNIRLQNVALEENLRKDIDALEEKITTHAEYFGIITFVILAIMSFIGYKTIQGAANKAIENLTAGKLRAKWNEEFQIYYNQRTEELVEYWEKKFADFDKRRAEYESSLKDIKAKIDKIDITTPIPENIAKTLNEFEARLERLKKEEGYTAGDWFIRGLREYNQADYAAAKKSWSKAIELDPDRISAYHNRGTAHFKLKEYDKALADYGIVIQLDPNKPDAYYNRGLAYSKIREYDKAFADYDKAIQLDPKFISAYQNIAESLIIMGKYDLASVKIDRAMSMSVEAKEKTVLLYLKCIAGKLLCKDTTEPEIELEEILKEDIALKWSFDDIEEWMIAADIPEETRKFIEEKTEILKKKMK